MRKRKKKGKQYVEQNACMHERMHACECIYILTHTDTDRQTDRQTDRELGDSILPLGFND